MAMNGTEDNQIKGGESDGVTEDQDLPAEAPGATGAGPGEQAIEDLEEKNRFYVDQLQRARAELDNFRRRTLEEREQQRRRSTIDVFRMILPLFDDLQMALQAETESSKLGDGLRIIADKFEKILKELSIERVEAVGCTFDPAWHEALFQVETTEHPEGEVLEEFERGYHLGEELIRPARVKVAKAPVSEKTEDPE